MPLFLSKMHEKPKFENIISYENLYKAFVQTAKSSGKSKRYRPETLRFYADLEENLIILQNELIWKTYKLSKMRKFIVYEPKKREISALPIRDRVVQTALCMEIEPYINERFINDSYACIKNKGTYKAAQRIAYFQNKSRNSWYLQCDVKKYFYSIDIDILFKIIKKRFIDDTNILWLIKLILNTNGNKKGICIGSRFSQLAANIYLNELDFYIKQNLHIKYYARYMDDFIIFENSKSKCLAHLIDIEKFLADELELELNKRTKILQSKQGIIFVGFRIFRHNMLVRQRVVRNAHKVITNYRKHKISFQKACKIAGSYYGRCKGTASYKFCAKFLLDLLNEAAKRLK